MAQSLSLSLSSMKREIKQECNAFQEDIIAAGKTVLDDCPLCEEVNVLVKVGHHKSKALSGQLAVGSFNQN